jgi:hypothetical protein
MLTLIRNAAAFAALSPTLLFKLLVECRAAKTELVRVVLRRQSSGSEVRLAGLPVGL